MRALPGHYNFTVEATDSAGTPQVVTQALSIVIDASGLAIDTVSLAAGQVASAYSDTLSASGAVGPYAWAVTVGALPDGLALDTATGAITGTPTVDGTFNFTVEVTDSSALAADGDEGAEYRYSAGDAGNYDGDTGQRDAGVGVQRDAGGYGRNAAILHGR